MLNTKLILVDGITGSGKSTTAHFIARQLEKNGIKAKWLHEIEKDHPLLELEKENDESDFDFNQRILRDYPKKWIDFVNKIKYDNYIYIIESYLFQNLLSTLVANDLDKQIIKSFAQQIISIANDLNPAIIHFYQKNVEQAIKENWQRRGDGWKKGFSDMENYLYCKNRNYEGKIAIFKFFQELTNLSVELFSQLRYHKIQIENSAQNWKHYRKLVMDFLEILHVEELIYHDSFEQYCGFYSGIIIHTKGNRLYADHFWPNLKLLPIGEDQFEIEGFPIVYKFIVDTDNSIKSLIIAKVTTDYAYKEGQEWPKIKTIKLSKQEKMMVCGTYLCKSKMLERKIFLNDDILYYSMSNGNESRLVAIMQNKFMMQSSKATLLFDYANQKISFIHTAPNQDDLHFTQI